VIASPGTPLAVIETVSEDGARIRVRRHGSPRGPRLMLSHGNGFAIGGYFNFWRRFLRDFDVVVFDMRSHGENPCADPPNHDHVHMVPDLDAVCRAVADEFGRKPTAGLFHSMSAQCAMLQALAGRNSFEALVLFDPPNVPPQAHPVRGKMEEYEHKLARWARQRRTHFGDPLELAMEYASPRSGQRWAEGAAELMAKAVLQPDPAGGWRLTCPRELEAAMYLQVIPLGLWPQRSDFAMPVKLIGADPDRPHPAATALSNQALAAEGGFDYAAIPGTTHLLQLEEPALCAEAALEFLTSIGFR
jgi:pimeloyl-ACP methyl ester carboxylesterase